ncbi:MAG: hypothetical protein U0230_25405 [Polyangiales bacterium]
MVGSAPDTSAIETDTRLFPLVVISFLRISDEAFERAFRDSERLMAAGRPWVVLRDFRFLASQPTAKQRRRAAEWTAANAEPLGRLCLGAVSVVPQPLVRSALAVVHWVTPPPMPEHVCRDVREGVDWCIGRLELSGLEVTDAMRALRDHDASLPF